MQPADPLSRPTEEQALGEESPRSVAIGEATPEASLAVHLPCYHCQYDVYRRDLRSVCPECSAPVHYSVMRYDLHTLVRDAGLRRIELGMWLWTAWLAVWLVVPALGTQAMLLLFSVAFFFPILTALMIGFAPVKRGRNWGMGVLMLVICLPLTMSTVYRACFGVVVDAWWLPRDGDQLLSWTLLTTCMMSFLIAWRHETVRCQNAMSVLILTVLGIGLMALVQWSEGKLDGSWITAPWTTALASFGCVIANIVGLRELRVLRKRRSVYQRALKAVQPV